MAGMGTLQAIRDQHTAVYDAVKNGITDEAKKRALTDKLADLRKKYDEVTATHAAAQRMVGELEVEKRNLRETAEANQRGTNESNARLDTLTAELAGAKAQLDTVTKQKEELDAQIARGNEQVTKLWKEMEVAAQKGKEEAYEELIKVLLQEPSATSTPAAFGEPVGRGGHAGRMYV
jgi:chromosome segregation ATPase